MWASSAVGGGRERCRLPSYDDRARRPAGREVLPSRRERWRLPREVRPGHAPTIESTRPTRDTSTWAAATFVAAVAGAAMVLAWAAGDHSHFAGEGTALWLEP